MKLHKQPRISDGKICKIYVESDTRGANFVMPEPHCHPYCELYYIHRGACRFFIEDGIIDLREGDFLFIPEQVYHYTRYVYGICKKTSVFFRGDELENWAVDVLPGGDYFFAETHFFKAGELHRGHFDSLITSMNSEEKISDGFSEPMLRIFLHRLLLLMVRECAWLDAIPEDIRTTDDQIVKAAQYIRTHYMERITMGDIAAAAGYSGNYLSRKFKKVAGVGVHEYLLYTRLRIAAAELATTADSVADIAYRCGFSDGNYFKDAFKKKYGMSPSAYRG